MTKYMTALAVVCVLALAGAGCSSDEPTEKATASPPTAERDTPPKRDEGSASAIALLSEGQDLFMDIASWADSNMDVSTAADIERVCSQLRTYERKLERIEEIVDEVASTPLSDDKSVATLDESIYELQGVFDTLNAAC